MKYKHKSTKWFVILGIAAGWGALACAWLSQWNYCMICAGIWLMLLTFTWGRDHR